MLIAVKSSLDIKSRKIDVQCSAEILTVEITLSNKTKFCLSTFYRVGTLGSNNFNAVKDYYNKILKRKNLSRIYVVGDFNFPDLNREKWETGQSDVLLEQNFLSMFSDLGLTQCIDEPTHNKGNILDLLLTSSPPNPPKY